MLPPLRQKHRAHPSTPPRWVASLLWLLVGASLTWPAHAQTSERPPAEAATEQVRARLVVPVTAVQPGQTLEIGLQQHIAEHWHTYWLNPGDSGVATSINWTLPAGAQASPIEWPTPTRFQTGPVVSYGHTGDVTLLSRLQVPTSLRAGENFQVQATVDWLVCEDTCVPQQVVLGLSLPVQAAAPLPSPDAEPLRQARLQLPPPSPWPAHWRRSGASALQLQLDAPGGLPPHDDAYFYPALPGQIDHAARQVLAAPGDSLRLVPGESPPAAETSPAGVLVFYRQGQPAQSYVLGELQPAQPARGEPPGQALTPLPASVPLHLLPALGLALLGGLVLNLMPCVFPVLSIKALSILSMARDDHRMARLHGLAYTAGVLVSFLAMAVALVTLKAGGAGVGWGFQFQSPGFVLLMALLMFGLGLMLSGVITLGTSISGVGSALADRGGFSGSFFTGVLATVVATPCTAPFMGAALGYALTQSAPVTLAVFAALGVGMALPYLALSWWPALQRNLPRPGAWMELLKQGLAFPMYATAAWLAWVLTQQAGSTALAVVLGGAVLLALAAWLFQGTRHLGSRGRWLATGLSAALAIGASGLGAWTVQGLPIASTAAAAGPQGVADTAWLPYSPERLQALRDQGQPVFINLTADWCLTCLVNERVALHQPSVNEAFERAGVTRLKGDWTLRDVRITRLLAEHGRTGVPLYLYYPAGADALPQVLPQWLTPELLRETLSRPPDQTTP